jgi:uncharacterized double-CXXCG motif protein
MRLFRIREAVSSRYFWNIQAEHQWHLSGVHCPTCDETWGGAGEAYPSVDLSALPDRRKFRARVEEDFEEFIRMRESVRPLVPEGASLEPGTDFGMLVGRGHGPFPQLVLLHPWTLLIHREALEQLQAAGLRGLMGCKTQLRLRDKNPPDLLELQIEPRGRLHQDCLPRGLRPPCRTCGRQAFSFPTEPLLDAATLPTDLDLFRLASFKTKLIGTERFVKTVQRLGFDEVEFQELPTR